ncbi:hypothetical protein SprV_0301256600 [Sparganum proliferum]
MGIIRKSMLKNEILQRPQLGKPLLRGRPRQPDCFIYGMRSEHDPEALIRCLRWPIPKRRARSDFPRDFLRTNIESAKAGIHPVPDWEEFADKKDFKLDTTKQALGRNKKPHFPKNMIFGHPQRPHTPIKCVLEHKYKTEFDEAAIARNKKVLMQLAISQNKIPQPYDTLKSVAEMAPLLPPLQGGKPWHQRRYRQTPARVSSYWTKEEEGKIMGKIFEKPVCDVQTD